MIEGQLDLLIMAIKDGKAVAVSDGFFKEQHGAAAWMIKGETAAVCICGAGLTSGALDDQSMHCSELFGLWGPLASLKQLCTEFHLGEGTVVIACDGLSALKKASSTYPTDPGKAHYDLISAIRNIRKSLPVNIQFKHIKGHQDNGTPTALTHLAWLNINMDIQAKGKLQSPGPTQPIHNIPFEGWTCTIEGQRIIKNITSNL